MFTLEIGGRPTAIINTSKEDAQAILDGEGFQEDLRRLKTDDVPLWDGKAALTLRPATEEEMAEFEESEEDDEEEEEDDAATILFLVPFDDEDDEEDEDAE
jgi:hypothetical protein